MADNKIAGIKCTGRKKIEENLIFIERWKKMFSKKIHHLHSASFGTVSEHP
jgi:hypothetical protein